MCGPIFQLRPQIISCLQNENPLHKQQTLSKMCLHQGSVISLISPVTVELIACYACLAIQHQHIMNLRPIEYMENGVHKSMDSISLIRVFITD